MLRFVARALDEDIYITHGRVIRLRLRKHGEAESLVATVKAFRRAICELDEAHRQVTPFCVSMSDQGDYRF